MEQIIVIVIAPSRKPEKALLNTFKVDTNNWACVGMNKEGQEYEKRCHNSLLFMLINQCQKTEDIKGKLNEINDLNKNVIVYTHQNADGTHQPFPCDSITTIFNEKIISCIPFSHSDNGDQPIEKFMSNTFCVWDERKKILQGIIDDCIKKKTTSDAHSLRSQILTPFVALHLALQYAEENKDFELMKECEATFEKIEENDKDKKVKEFLKTNGLDGKYNELKGKDENNDLKSKIDGLCEAIANNKTTELAMYIDLIGDFADALEKAVESAGNK